MVSDMPPLCDAPEGSDLEAGSDGAFSLGDLEDFDPEASDAIVLPPLADGTGSGSAQYSGETRRLEPGLSNRDERLRPVQHPESNRELCAMLKEHDFDLRALTTFLNKKIAEEKTIDT